MSGPPAARGEGERRLALARWLLDAGAGRSACNVLGGARGAAANRVRLSAARAELRPGVYALVALPDGGGAALPLRPSPGRSRAVDADFREACALAHECARRLLGPGPLPALRFEFEEELAVFGPSIGLPAALAFLAHFAPARAPRSAVLATGRLLDGGRVAPVGRLATKGALAAAERGAGLIVVPGGDDGAPEGAIRALDLEGAARAVFGPAPLAIDVALAPLEVVLHRARTAPDAAEGVAMLEALEPDALPAADRARLLFDLGTLRRNLGHSHEAARLHERARALLDAERAVIGGEAAERFELECWATAIDQFRLGEATRALEARLGAPFLKLRNELRCRGMLAQALSMAGRHREALAVRRGNLPLHERSEALRKVLPATLCHLALDAARSGEADAFERLVLDLEAATRPGDEAQRRFNAAALVRGLVALGRHELALGWARDERRAFGQRAPVSLARAASGAAPTAEQPEASALRALARALRRTGRPADAARLGEAALAAAEGLDDLYGWVARLSGLEAALALAELGDEAGAASTLRRVRAALPALHPAATRHHAPLLDASGARLEVELDRVWY
ncbi:MAG TPA: hypothetical protein VFS43_17415 [Polyangiaceae bacterium]|nr:hypothetical protein [Polyangiaceae bacterium]